MDAKGKQKKLEELKRLCLAEPLDRVSLIHQALHIYSAYAKGELELSPREKEAVYQLASMGDDPAYILSADELKEFARDL